MRKALCTAAAAGFPAATAQAQEGFPLDGTWRGDTTAKDGSHRTIVLIMQWDGKQIERHHEPRPGRRGFHRRQARIPTAGNSRWMRRTPRARPSISTAPSRIWASTAACWRASGPRAAAPSTSASCTSRRPCNEAQHRSIDALPRCCWQPARAIAQAAGRRHRRATPTARSASTARRARRATGTHPPPPAWSRRARRSKFPPNGKLKNLADAAKVAPFQPWALALVQAPPAEQLRGRPDEGVHRPGQSAPDDDAGRRALHPGQQLQAHVHDLRRRQPHLAHHLHGWSRAAGWPKKSPPPSCGLAVGKWEGDTLVATSTGFNTRFWMSERRPAAHRGADADRTVQARLEANVLEYEVTIDDPRTYTRPWKAAWTLQAGCRRRHRRNSSAKTGRE